MESPFQKRNKVKTHGQKSEQRTARRFGVRARAGSGAVEGFKGDFELSEFLVENKATEKKSISLKYDWLSKISKEALTENKEPALAIQFVDLDGKPRAKDATWIVMSERMFMELTK